MGALNKSIAQRVVDAVLVECGTKSGVVDVVAVSASHTLLARASSAQHAMRQMPRYVIVWQAAIKALVAGTDLTEFPPEWLKSQPEAVYETAALTGAVMPVLAEKQVVTGAIGVMGVAPDVACTAIRKVLKRLENSF